MPQRDIFLSIQSAGAILPPDMLARIASGDAIDGLTPAAYHLAASERVGEAVTRSWTRLAGLWAGLQDALTHLPGNDPATGITRERFLLPLFQELGYGRLQVARAVEIEGKPYPISHAWNNVPIHLVGHGVNLDRRSKGVAGAATQSPHALVQELLNRSPERLYGFAANGATLRLLRDNNSLTRQAYVEFDLAQMFTNDLFADFFLLWLVCHQSRFEGDPVEDCWLERWNKQAAGEGTRALEDLRKGVEEAIAALGRGFLAHPANTALKESLRAGTLTRHDYYRQVLRCIYRLMFLFVAEDRGALLDANADPLAQERFLRFYSTARLRELAARVRGTRHSDLYAMVKVVFAALGQPGGAPGLALPALGSFLWSHKATRDLDGASLSNADLLSAVRALAFVTKAGLRRSIDYRNLGSEELGSVYESLLELHPEIQIDATAHEDRFKLGTVTGHERRTTGSYYTPRELVASLLDTALDPVLDLAAGSPDPEDAILSLKVCDPAAGSGHFLISAAHRMAKRLAAARSGEEEPAPSALRQALRDVISHCLYAVDVNPMAVELCKISLWMESVEGSQPLSFLDSHIKTGNSLLGTTPELIEAGIPDAAFNAISGDDKQAALSLKRQNKLERDQELKGQGLQFPLDLSSLNEPAAELAERVRQLDGMPEESIAAVRQKEKAHFALLSSDPYQRAKLTADAWCAAFFQEKSKDSGLRITQGMVRRLSEDLTAVSAAECDAITAISTALGFFHWHVEFPKVFSLNNPGGFEVVLGNPPWERVKLQEKEFFASRMQEILKARNKSDRRKLIDNLKLDDPSLYRDFHLALRKSEGESLFIHTSGRFPLCGRGDVNTYAIFGEAMRALTSDSGRTGCVLPLGIATDDTTKHFFADIATRGSLVSLWGFENESFIFPGIHHATKFCLMTLAGAGQSVDAMFAFFLRNTSQLGDHERRFTLSPDDFALLNPNTKTCPIFRTRRDAEITKAIYRRVPVLIDYAAGAAGNPWGVTLSTMFHMSNDSGLFRVRSQLVDDGFILQGNVFVKGKERWLPLYEAKMIHHFDHRFGTYDGQSEAQANQGKLPELTDVEHSDPSLYPLPRYWVHEREVQNRLPGIEVSGWLVGFRDITGSVVQRTLISSVIPRAGVGNSLPLIMTVAHPDRRALIAPTLTSFISDYLARQKVGGTHLNYFIFEQLPVLLPTALDEYASWDRRLSIAAWMKSRLLELTVTSWDLESFANDLGYHGPPFRWDPERRSLLRSELDAAFFHLYGTSAEDADYILETFPIVKKKDMARFGSYRTKHLILEIYDSMAKAIATGEPYRTVLNPPPAHASIAHSRRDQLAIPAAIAALRLAESPAESEKYRTLVPLFDLKAAAGAFGDVQAVGTMGWVEAPGHKLREGMFVAHVVGHSMEPRIPSGSYCLFAHPAGTNQGKIVLAQHRDIWDPETGGSYTVKRYRSTKKYNADGTWEHTEIRLEPLNPTFEPIIIKEVEEGELRLIAELIEVYPGTLEKG